MPSPAYQRFIASMQMDYEKWHDGIGYDLDALADMSADERTQVTTMLRGRTDWRDAEALEALSRLGVASANATLNAIVEDESAPIEQRLIAIERLRDSGQLSDSDLERLLLPALRRVEAFAGLTPALRLVQQVPTPAIRRRLLWGVLHQPEAAVHFAAMLAYLAGVAKEEFDWDLRDLFLRTRHGSDAERAQAVGELCGMIGMASDDAA